MIAHHRLFEMFEYIYFWAEELLTFGCCEQQMLQSHFIFLFYNSLNFYFEIVHWDSTCLSKTKNVYLYVLKSVQAPQNLHYDLWLTYFDVFSKRIPSHGLSNRIWIALRFIHTEIYFSKEWRKKTRHMLQTCEKIEINTKRKRQMWPQGLNTKQSHWSIDQVPSKSNKNTNWTHGIFDSKTKFVYITALSVISIKGYKYSDERAPFTLVDFIWFPCMPIFYHIWGFVLFFFLNAKCSPFKTWITETFLAIEIRSLIYE